MSAYYIVDEPSGSTYEELLAAGAEAGSSFGFVLREGEELGDRARSILNELKPYLLEERDADEWPGTRLFGGSRAQVLVYRIKPETLRVLVRSANRLYEWQHPHLPEDLFIRKSDRTVWLSSIAHEGEAFLDITSEEASQLQDRMPGLVLELGDASWPGDEQG